MSAVARSLATSKTRTIGVVVTSVRDPFVAEVVTGIENMAINHGYSVFLASCNAEAVRGAKVVQSFEERRVDGIIVMDSRVGSLYAAHLSKMKIPIVLINKFRLGEFIYSVAIDNLTASRDATSHLIRLGHTRIAYIGAATVFSWTPIGLKVTAKLSSMLTSLFSLTWLHTVMENQPEGKRPWNSS